MIVYADVPDKAGADMSADLVRCYAYGCATSAMPQVLPFERSISRIIRRSVSAVIAAKPKNSEPRKVLKPVAIAAACAAQNRTNEAQEKHMLSVATGCSPLL